ncbi:unnamed protein product [Mytilus edulis]|uniref:Uncharacterized protein n=1 Tax=Mytilus edulis TaxID=6550 RepID=A0A8S3TTE5_MYTED|nr:unnamed protein product [Mytilus edulis]
MLIGADFLIKHGAILDVPAKKMNLRNTQVHLKLGGETTTTNSPIVIRVTVQHTVIVPPNTALRIDLESADMATDYLIEPKGNTTLLVPRTVCAKGQKPSLCFLNITDNPVRIPKGDEVGYTQEVSVIQSMDEEPVPSVGTCTTPSTVEKGSPKSGIPSHLKDLNWARFLTDEDEVIPLVKPRNRQKQFKNVSSAMLQLFGTTSETLATPQAIETTESPTVLDSPNVDCNLDLTVSAPIPDQRKEDDTWFSTHIDLICLPTAAHIVIHDDTACHVASISQSEGISFKGFTNEEIKTKQSEDPDLLVLLNWLKDQVEPSQNTLFSASPAVKSYWINKEKFFLDDNGILKSYPKDEGASIRGRGTTMEGIGGTYELVSGVGLVLVEEASATSSLRVQGEQATLPPLEQAVLPPPQQATLPPAQKTALSTPKEDFYDYKCPRSGKMERSYLISQRDQRCPVRGCPVMTRSVKSHVLGEHLSFMFAPTQENHYMKDPSFHRYRGHMVMVLAQWLTGITSATYDDMVMFIRRNARVPTDYPQAGEEMPVFRTVCREMGWPTQAWFKIAPVCKISSPVCILHWRVMSSVLHFLTPTHQDMMFTEKYIQRENNLSLEVLQEMNKLFMASPVVSDLVPAGAESSSPAPVDKTSTIPDVPEVGKLCAAVAVATIQEEAIEAAISSKVETSDVPVSPKEVEQNPEDRCIVFLVWEQIRRMVPVHSLDNLRTLAEERFPGNGAATLFFQDTLIDPLITLKDIMEMESPRPSIEVRFLDSTKL